MGALYKSLSETAKAPLKHSGFGIAKVGTFLKAHALEFLSGYGSNPGDRPHFEGCRECVNLIGSHYFLAIGFIPIRGDFGQKLIDRNARGYSDVNFSFYLFAYRLGDPRS